MKWTIEIDDSPLLLFIVFFGGSQASMPRMLARKEIL